MLLIIRAIGMRRTIHELDIGVTLNSLRIIILPRTVRPVAALKESIDLAQLGYVQPLAQSTGLLYLRSTYTSGAESLKRKDAKPPGGTLRTRFGGSGATPHSIDCRPAIGSGREFEGAQVKKTLILGLLYAIIYLSGPPKAGANDVLSELETVKHKIPFRSHDHAGRILYLKNRLSPKSTVDSCIKALKHDDEFVRRTVINTLGRFGVHAKAAVPSIEDSLSDADLIVASEAVRALAAINPRHNKVLPVVAQLLKNNDHDRRLQAMVLLASDIALRRNVYVRFLRDALSSENVSERRIAAEALGWIGSGARGAIPSLVEALKDMDPTVRSNATLSLGWIEMDSKTVIRSLAKRLSDTDAGTRINALAMLVKLDPGNEELAEYRKHEDHSPHRYYAGKSVVVGRSLIFRNSPLYLMKDYTVRLDWKTEEQSLTLTAYIIRQTVGRFGFDAKDVSAWLIDEDGRLIGARPQGPAGKVLIQVSSGFDVTAIVWKRFALISGSRPVFAHVRIGSESFTFPLKRWSTEKKGKRGVRP